VKSSAKKKAYMGNKKLISSIFIALAIIIVGIIVFFMPSSEKDIFEETPKPNPVYEVCESFCETGQKNAFCSVRVKADTELSRTCYELATNPAYSQYNVATCPDFSCNA